MITQIGSLPYDNVNEAIDYSLKHNIPFLPELPSKGETMLTSEIIRRIKRERDRRKEEERPQPALPLPEISPSQSQKSPAKEENPRVIVIDLN